MIKVTKTLELPKATFELTRKGDNCNTLWIHNKSIDEHISITLTFAEFKELKELICADLY